MTTENPKIEVTEAVNSNGKNRTTDDTVDVRTIPTGTLIYNLIRYTAEELGLESALHQILAQLEAQKMVGEPPQVTRMKEKYQQYSQFRYRIATEINTRFQDADAAYFVKLGIETIDLTQGVTLPQRPPPLPAEDPKPDGP